MLSACGQPSAPPSRSPDLQALLGNVNEKGFARAMQPRVFHFPADFGPHDRYRSEWWYYTGTLRDSSGRRFGFELTFFRFALAPHKPPGASPWISNQIYMADFAITDPKDRRFFAWQRFSRDALGLAGAQAQPFEVWVDDWSIRHVKERWRPENSGKGVNAPCAIEGVCAAFPWVLRAQTQTAALRLELTPRQGIVLNGERGLSQKGPAAGDASYYYSMPRLNAHGELRIEGKRFKVSGEVWFDREWSTSALAANQVGWDWFALRLADGSDLMFYRLRDRNGRTDPHSAGTWVSPQGEVIHLRADEVKLKPLGFWSDSQGRRYPVRWLLRVPSLGLVLEIQPWMRDQALNLAIPYWEGAVSVTGKRGKRSERGSGYLELTGYGRR